MRVARCVPIGELAPLHFSMAVLVLRFSESHKDVFECMHAHGVAAQHRLGNPDKPGGRG